CSRLCCVSFFFFSSRRRHTRSKRDWSSDVCSSDLGQGEILSGPAVGLADEALERWKQRVRDCGVLPGGLDLIPPRPVGERDHGAGLERIEGAARLVQRVEQDRKSTRLNSSHVSISYAVFCLKKKRTQT